MSRHCVPGTATAPAPADRRKAFHVGPSRPPAEVSPAAHIGSAVLRRACSGDLGQDMVSAVCEIACRVLDVDLDLVSAGTHPVPSRWWQVSATPSPGEPPPMLSLPLRDMGRTLGTVSLHRRGNRPWTGPDRAGAHLVARLLSSYLALAQETPAGPR